MDHDEQGEIIEESREQGGFGDVEVTRAGQIRHQEGGGPHDRGHELPAGGGDGFHRAGEGGAVADLLHERDGEGAGPVDVGGGASRDGPEQGRGENGDLGGPPCELRVSRQARSIKMELILERSRNAPNMMNPNRVDVATPIGMPYTPSLSRKRCSTMTSKVKPVGLTARGQHVSEEGVQDKRRGHDDQRPGRGGGG